MALNKAQMLALLEDNSTGDISASDMRDIVTGLKALEDYEQSKTTVLTLQPQGSAPTSHVPGTLYYKDGLLNVQTAYDGVTLQVGEEQHVEVYNNTGVTISEGVAVRYIGTASGYASVELAIATNFTTSKSFGVTTMDIHNGQTGLVTVYGLVNDLDLSAFSNGDTLFLSDTVPGAFTATAPDIATKVGLVFSDDSVTGQLFVKPEANISIPTVVAFMREGSLAGDIEATYKDINNYVLHGNAVMVYDAAVGTITVPSTGIYKLTVNLSFLFDIVGNAEETFYLRLNGNISGNADLPVTVPRNGGAANYFPKISFDAVAGEVFKLQIGGATTTLTNVTEPLLSFEIESSHIR